MFLNSLMRIDIHNEDCFELFKRLGDNSVDLLVLDPPYFRVMAESDLKYGWDKQKSNLNDYVKWVKEWLIECRRVLKDEGSMFIFTADKISAYTQLEADKIFDLLNIITWVKKNPISETCWRFRKVFSKSTERILFYGGGDDENRVFKQDKDYTTSWISRIVFDLEKTYGHPTQKPYFIVERIVKTCSNEGDLVVDCFGGSFTTAVVCNNLNRNFMGCDISGEYCEIGKKRLREANWNRKIRE